MQDSAVRWLKRKKKRPHLVENQISKSLKEIFKWNEIRISTIITLKKCFPAATTWTSTEWKPDSRMEPFFPSTASSLRTNMATPRHSEQNWTGYLYNKPLEYTQLVLSGEIEHYLSLGCDHGRLEDW
jgi:hypothetical protein